MNHSVIKALTLLDLFTAEQRELSLSDIARKSELPKPTAYRLLRSLESCGFLKKVKYSDQDMRYRLGLKLMELGNIVLEQSDLRKVALPHMTQLGTAVEEAVHLVIVDGAEAVYIEKVDSKHHIRLYTRVGKRSPLHAGSGSKLLLAFMEEEREALLREWDFEPLTANSITSRSQLEEELQRIVTNGYATSDGEQTLETIGLSFPIYDYTNKVVAALTISGMKSRFGEDRMPYLLEETSRAAQAISKDLGYLKSIAYRTLAKE
jgi:IclR family KDG regulon transcriptional repressor